MTPSISERLAEMLSFLRCVEKEFQYYSSLLSEADRKKVDLLHFLELDASDVSGTVQNRDTAPIVPIGATFL